MDQSNGPARYFSWGRAQGRYACAKGALSPGLTSTRGRHGSRSEVQFSGRAYASRAGLAAHRRGQYLGACREETSGDGTLADI